MMHLAKTSDRGFVLEGERLTGWVVWLYFRGIFLALLVEFVRTGNGNQLVWAFLCGGVLLVGIPFIAFATSSYPHLVVESGAAVRKYAVNRMAGPRLLHDIPWDSIDKLLVELEVRPGDDARLPRLALKLTAQSSMGTSVLGRYDGDTTSKSLEAPVKVLRCHFGERLALVGLDPPQSEIA